MKFCRNGPACGICQYVDHIVINGEKFCPQMIFLSVTLTGIMSLLKFLDNEPLSVGWGWTKATPWIAWTSSWQSSLRFGFSWDDIEQELYCWVGNFNSLWEFAPFSGTFARFFWQDNCSSLFLFLGADLLAVFILLDPEYTTDHYRTPILTWRKYGFVRKDEQSCFTGNWGWLMASKGELKVSG